MVAKISPKLSVGLLVCFCNKFMAIVYKMLGLYPETPFFLNDLVFFEGYKMVVVI